MSHQQSQEIEDTCNLCFTRYGEESSGDNGDSTPAETALTLPGCGHVMGNLCIALWFDENHVATCPFCRQRKCGICFGELEREPYRPKGYVHDTHRIFHETPNSVEVLSCGHLYHYRCIQPIKYPIGAPGPQEDTRRCPHKQCGKPLFYWLCKHIMLPRLENHWQCPDEDDAILDSCADCRIPRQCAHWYRALDEATAAIAELRLQEVQWMNLITARVPNCPPWEYQLLRVGLSKVIEELADQHDILLNHQILLRMEFESYRDGKRGCDLASTGRVEMLHEEHVGQSWPPFSTTDPPDIDSNTRIVGLLGIQGEKVEDKFLRKPATCPEPSPEGWFVSDFCLFWWLCRNVSPHQTWLHSCNFKDLVREHKYYHGNPFRDNRKVVLDEDLLKDMESDTQKPTSISGEKLLKTFLDVLETEHTAAKENNQKLMVLIFAHGDASATFFQEYRSAHKRSQGRKFMLSVGTPPSNPSRDDRPAGIVRSDLDNNFDGSVDVSFFTTACYSGGWISQKYIALNATGMTAVGIETSSVAWIRRARSTANRFAGSVWATSVAEVLAMDPESMKSLLSLRDVTEEQAAAQAGLTKAVEVAMLKNIDRGAYQHQVTFSPQDDKCAEPWTKRMGHPVNVFKENLDRLPTIGRDQTLWQGDPRNRDPSVTEEEREAYRNHRAAMFPEQTAQYWLDCDPSDPDAAERAAEDREDEAEARARIKELRKKNYASAFGNGPDQLAAIHKMASTWRNSFPGDPADAETTSRYHYDGSEVDAMWAHIRKFESMLKNDEEWDQNFVDFIYRALGYRFAVMEDADCFAKFAGLLPNGKRCAMFNNHAYTTRHVDSERYQAIATKIDGYGAYRFFPEPVTAECGQWSYKGIDYLVCAFHQSDLTIEEIHLSITQMYQHIQSAVAKASLEIQKDPNVLTAMQKLFRVFKKTVPPSLTASKHSRGLSVATDAQTAEAASAMRMRSKTFGDKTLGTCVRDDWPEGTS